MMTAVLSTKILSTIPDKNSRVCSGQRIPRGPAISARVLMTPADQTCPKCSSNFKFDWKHNGNWCRGCDHYISKKALMVSAANPNWKYLGSGRHRVVWLLPSGYVIKIPSDGYGEAANIREANYKKNIVCNIARRIFRNQWKVARCRLIPDTFVLVMEFVTCYSDLDITYEQLPKWAKEVDCSQVGYNSRGELVAYDFAEN